MTLPRTSGPIALDGRQSKVIVTDYTFGTSKLLYSTASIFFAGKIGTRDVLFLFGDSNQSHEAALYFKGNPVPTATGAKTNASSVVTIRTDTTPGSNNILSTVTVMPGSIGLVTIWESESQMVLFSDSVTAATFWAPVIPGSGSNALAHYWQFGSNETVLVGGPYLVRNATIKNTELALTGDLNASVPLTVIAPSNVKTVSWNGAVVPELAGDSLSSPSAMIKGQLSRKISANSVPTPALNEWKFADSLPEILPEFSDASWITANHTTTNIITPPFYGDGRILYGCDYGL